MDEAKGLHDIISGDKQGKNIVPLIGHWTIEKNYPYGFVIRNMSDADNPCEYHFWHQSNGWLSTKIGSRELNCVTPHGAVGLEPVFCDAEAIKKHQRIDQLKNVGKKLSHSEAKELLVLCGIIKES